MGRVGVYQLDKELRSSLRLDIDVISEGAVPPTAIQPSIGGAYTFKDVPSFSDTIDQDVILSLVSPKYLAIRDGDTYATVDIRLDLFWYPVSTNIVGDKYAIRAKLHQVEPGITTAGTSVTETVTQLLSGATAEQLQHTRDLSPYTLVFDNVNLKRNTLWYIQLSRLGADVTDTAAGNFVLLGAELVFTPTLAEPIPGP